MTDEPEDQKKFPLLLTLNIVVKVGAIFATLFAIFQYLAAREDRRVERSLGYVSRFSDHGSAIGMARLQVSAALWANETQLLRLKDVLQRLPEDEGIALRARFIEKLMQGGGDAAPIRVALDPIVSFFDELQVCIDTNLCDGQAADAFFQDYVITFWDNFGAAILDRRDLNPRYGWGIQAFFTRRDLSPDQGEVQ